MLKESHLELINSEQKKKPKQKTLEIYLYEKQQKMNKSTERK